VAFDKDGTLLSFDAMWGGWARELGARLEGTTRRPVAGDVFAAIGFDPTSGHVAPTAPLAIGTSEQIADTITAVLRRWCPSVAAARRALAAAWFLPDPRALAVPLADLPGLFGRLRARGMRIAVVTTDDRAPTLASLDAIGVGPLVDAVVAGDDGIPTKPDPAAVVGLAARFGLEPAAIAVVGDTPADLRMGRGAGAGLAVGVLSGLGTREMLEPLADALLASVAELA